MFRLFTACLLSLFLVSQSPLFAQEYAYVVLGPKGAVARVLSTSGDCPEVIVNDEKHAMSVRANPNPEKFPVTVCEWLVPREVDSLTVGSFELKARFQRPKSILVLGDTGCRIKDDWVQNCNGAGEGPEWCFEELATNAAKDGAELIMHVGDYLYRESPCPEGNKGCEGSPYGDTWATWQVDFFEPAKALLPTAPWLFARGNHEDCKRAWQGFFFFLDPNSPTPGASGDCPDYPLPYTVTLGDQYITVFDTANLTEGDDGQVLQSQVDIFKKQIDTINQTTSDLPTWTLTHRPVWAIDASDYPGPETTLGTLEPTLQAAVSQSQNGAFANQVKLNFAGHIHDFQVVTFTDGRPTQIVAGAGGTLLDPEITPKLEKEYSQVFTELNITPRDFKTFDNFNFLILKDKRKGWEGILKTADGKEETCFNFK